MNAWLAIWVVAVIALAVGIHGINMPELLSIPFVLLLIPFFIVTKD